MDMVIKKNHILNMGLFLMLLHPFFLYILNTFKIYQMPLTAIAVLIFLFCMRGYFSRYVVVIINWCALFVYMAVRNVGDYELILYYLFCALMMYVLAVNFNWRKFFITLLLIFALPNAAATILLFIFPELYEYIKPLITAEKIMYEGYKTGLTGHYSTNAIYLACGLIVAAGMFFTEYRDRKKRKQQLLLVIVFLISLLLTTKRGPLIFSVTALFGVYILTDTVRTAGRLIKMSGALLLLIVIIYVAAYFVPELSEVFQRFSEDGTSGRDTMYALAFSMFLENPIFGCGTGTYRLSYYTYLSKGINRVYLNTHNVYLQLLCENGVIGLCIFLTAALVTLYKSIVLLRYYHKNGELEQERCMTISVAFQLFFLMYCMTGNPLYDSMMYLPYFGFCAMTYSYLIEEHLLNILCIDVKAAKSKSRKGVFTERKYKCK